MSDSEETLFRERRPSFTEMDAAKLFYQYGAIVSADGREGPIGDSFLVLFVSEKGLTAGPLALNRAVARWLCERLIAAGHGPPASPPLA